MRERLTSPSPSLCDVEEHELREGFRVVPWMPIPLSIRSILSLTVLKIPAIIASLHLPQSRDTLRLYLDYVSVPIFDDIFLIHPTSKGDFLAVMLSDECLAVRVAALDMRHPVHHQSIAYLHRISLTVKEL